MQVLTLANLTLDCYQINFHVFLLPRVFELVAELIVDLFETGL